MKSILVHLDHEDCSVRLALARQLALTHRARLVGLFAEKAKASTVGMVAVWPSDAYRAAAAASEQAFATATAGVPAEWRDANRGGEAEVIKAVVAAAHAVDLTVLGKDQGGAVHSGAPAGLAEQVVLKSGRPCLIVPNHGAFDTLGRRPLIAWNGGREAARAMLDAVPLMRGCEEATLLSIGEVAHDATADCLRWLEEHGVKARFEHLEGGDIGAMDLILARAGDLAADLLVIGAHEQSGGGLSLRAKPNGARHILAEATLPVAMSH